MKSFLSDEHFGIGLLGLFLGGIFFPQVASAQVFNPSGGELGVLLVNLVIFINDTLIPFIVALGFLFFVWGVFRFFIYGAADEESRQKGKSLIIYSIIGFVVIIIFWGVVNMFASSTGLVGEALQFIPTAP